ncbi:MAG: VCBS repeat-containing protein [Planctomycetota bacterium]
MKRVSRITAPLLAVAFLVTGCGYGSASLAGVLGDGERNNAAPTLGSLEVQGVGVVAPKTSPATVEVLLSDAESDPATIALSMVVPGNPQGEQVLRAVPGNPTTLETSAAGVRHTMSWDFAAEPSLPVDASYVEGVQLIARLDSGAAQSVVVGLGNDPPEITQLVQPAAEVAGITSLRFAVQDSSDDLVDIAIEYQEGGAGEWRLARPAGIDETLPTPEFAFAGVQALRTGSPLVFFWDTSFDLPDLERGVQLRVTPIDPVIAGERAVTQPFRVDDNDEPLVQVEGVAFGLNPNPRRGIPLPYTVFDDEGDPVRVLWQWRRQSSARFESLGTSDPTELAAWLEDPAYAREKQICTRFPTAVGGRAIPVDATRVRLPELVQGAAQGLASGVEFRELQLLRPQLAPAPLAGSWTRPNPLVAPGAVLPRGDGRSVLVADGPAAGPTALVEVDLATGAVVQRVVDGLAGGPTAMTAAATPGAVLVATGVASDWRLSLVEVATGSVTPLVRSGPSGPPGPIRAVLALGERAALVSAADGLWRLDWSDPTNPRQALVLGGPAAPLATPWGLARDPMREGWIWFAERDAAVPGGTGRVVAVDLERGAMVPLAVTAARGGGGPALPRATALAVQRGPSPGSPARLIALCDPEGQPGRELFAVTLGSPDPRAVSLGTVGADASSVAAGPSRLVVVTLPGSADLAAGGGIEQSRPLAAFDHQTATATVGVAFDPPPRPQQPWQLVGRDAFRNPIRGTPAGVGATFVWDSGDVGVGSPVLLKATVMDNELGTPAETAVPRTVSGTFAEQLLLGTSPDDWWISSLVPADLDADGDLDLVLANHDAGQLNGSLTLWLQDAPRTFNPQPLPDVPGLLPVAVAVADLDGDGDLDLAAARGPRFLTESSLVVFDQTAPRSFTPRAPIASTGSSPAGLVPADLDGDGDLDLAVPYLDSSELGLYEQTGSGGFQARPALPTGYGAGSVGIADLDGDGDLDLAVPHEFESGMTVFEQTAPWTFSATQVATASPSMSVVVADLDGDGDADLVTPAEVIAQTAPLVFAAQPVPPGGIIPSGVAVADVNDDGILDLAVADLRSERLSLYEQTPEGELKLQPPLATGPFRSHVEAADLDGDGCIDLPVGGNNDSELQILFGGVPRRFRAEAPVPTGDRVAALVAADLDRDGDLDLISAHRGTTLSPFGSTENLSIAYQDAPRTFATAPALPTGPQPVSVVAADVDGDGALDLVAADAMDDTVRNLLQTAPRQWSPQPPLATGDTPSQVVAADLDGDGDLDLACANSRSDDVWIFWQEGPGTFVAAPPLGTARFPTALAAADLDGDGDVDLVAASGAANSLTVLAQETPRAFTARATLPTGRFPRAIAAADLDGDGALDLVCANVNSDDVSVFFQDGPLLFTAAPPIAAADNPQSVVAADLDGDGDLDLAVSSGGTDEVVVVYQEAPRSFAAPLGYAAGDNPNAVAAGDLDGDGDTDLAAANTGSGDLSVLWGR